jgi:hypothetical protein
LFGPCRCAAQSILVDHKGSQPEDSLETKTRLSSPRDAKRGDAVSELPSSLPFISGRFKSTARHASASKLRLQTTRLAVESQNPEPGGLCQSRERTENRRIVVHHRDGRGLALLWSRMASERMCWDL